MTSLLPALFPALLLGLSSLPHASAYCDPPVLHNCGWYTDPMLQSLCFQGNSNEQEAYRQCLNGDSDDEDGSSGLSKGAMAGIIVGAIAAFVILIVTLVLVLRRRRRNRARKAQELPAMSPLELETGDSGSSDSRPDSPMKEKPLPRINLSALPPVLAKYPSAQDVEQNHKPTQMGTTVKEVHQDQPLVAGHLSVRPTYLTKLSTALACFWTLYFLLVLAELILTAPSSLREWGYLSGEHYEYAFKVPVEVALQVLTVLAALATTVVVCFWTRIAKRRSSGEEPSQGAFSSRRTQTIDRSLHGRFIAALATLGVVTLGLGAGSLYYFSSWYIDTPQDDIAVDVRRAALGVFVVSLVMHLVLVVNEFVALRRSRRV